MATEERYKTKKTNFRLTPNELAYIDSFAMSRSEVIRLAIRVLKESGRYNDKRKENAVALEFRQWFAELARVLNDWSEFKGVIEYGPDSEQAEEFLDYFNNGLTVNETLYRLKLYKVRGE